MSDAVVEALILEFLEWVAKRERSYEEVMDAGARHPHGNGTKALLLPTMAPLARGCELFNIWSCLPRFP